MNFIPLGVAPGLAVASTARARRLRSFALVAFCRRFIRSKLALRLPLGQRRRVKQESLSELGTPKTCAKRSMPNAQRPTPNSDEAAAALARLRAAPARQAERRYSRMARDQSERTSGQSATRRNFVPGGCTRRMRQWNCVKAIPGACNSESSANYFLQFFAVDKLHDSQPSDGNNQTRPQNSDLVVHPRRAVANLVRCRNAIRAAEIFSRKTAADGREINLRSNGGLVHPAELFEPPKKRFASSMCKRPLQNRFPRTGRLANDDDVAHNCTAGNRRGFHARATPAFEQLRNMSLQVRSFAIFRTHPVEKCDQ